MSTYDDNKKLTVVNMFSGPGVGKSTLAANVFAELKRQGTKVELVSEFAKEMVWEQRHTMFTEQDFIFAHQHRMIRRLVDHDIDYAIVDSSMFLGLLYTPDWYPPSFNQFVLDVFNTYDNVNILVERNSAINYVEAGRNQTLDQALDKDREVVQLLHKYNVGYHTIINDQYATNTIVDIIKTHKE